MAPFFFLYEEKGNFTKLFIWKTLTFIRHTITVCSLSGSRAPVLYVTPNNRENAFLCQSARQDLLSCPSYGCQ